MTTPAQRNLAEWLLAEESRDRGNPEALAETAERVCHKLSERLVELVTLGGSRMVLTRALYLARIAFPFLGGVQVGTSPDLSLDGLHDSAQGVEPAHMRAGLAAVVAETIGLLVTFIGEDLAVRLVRDVWPDAPFDEPRPATREA